MTIISCTQLYLWSYIIMWDCWTFRTWFTTTGFSWIGFFSIWIAKKKEFFLNQLFILFYIAAFILLNNSSVFSVRFCKTSAWAHVSHLLEKYLICKEIYLRRFTSYSNHHNEYSIAIHLFLHRVLIRESKQRNFLYKFALKKILTLALYVFPWCKANTGSSKYNNKHHSMYTSNNILVLNNGFAVIF